MNWIKGHRFWMHFPVGCIVAALLYIPETRPTGYALFYGFCLYEVWQGLRKKDMGFIDLRGGLFGLGFGGLGLLLWTIL